MLCAPRNWTHWLLALHWGQWWGSPEWKSCGCLTWPSVPDTWWPMCAVIFLMRTGSTCYLVCFEGIVRWNFVTKQVVSLFYVLYAKLSWRDACSSFILNVRTQERCWSPCLTPYQSTSKDVQLYLSRQKESMHGRARLWTIIYLNGQHLDLQVKRRTGSKTSGVVNHLMHPGQRKPQNSSHITTQQTLHQKNFSPSDVHVTTLLVMLPFPLS